MENGIFIYSNKEYEKSLRKHLSLAICPFQTISLSFYLMVQMLTSVKGTVYLMDAY